METWNAWWVAGAMVGFAIVAAGACGDDASSTSDGGTTQGTSTQSTTGNGGGATGGGGSAGTTGGDGGRATTSAGGAGGEATTSVGGAGGQATTTGTGGAPIDCMDDPDACPNGQGCVCGGPGGLMLCQCGDICTIDDDCENPAQPTCCGGFCSDTCLCLCD